MKFCPTVAEMADMSPMCSIMAARAMGAITRIAVRSNLADLEGGGRPRMLSLAHGGEIDEGDGLSGGVQRSGAAGVGMMTATI